MSKKFKIQIAMKYEEIQAMFESANQLPLRLTDRPRPADLTALNLLNQIFPDRSDMVLGAEHDEIWLAVTVADLEASSITQEQVNTLVRCGVDLDVSTGCLHMFV